MKENDETNEVLRTLEHELQQNPQQPSFEIWKFPLCVMDSQELYLPGAAKVLSVGLDMNGPVVWARVCPKEPLRQVRVCIAGTGHPLTSYNTAARFVGTFVLNGFVGHVTVDD